MSDSTANLGFESTLISDEPLKLTLTDILAVVFGFACFFALPPIHFLGGLSSFGVGVPVWVIVTLWAFGLLQGAALATMAAVLMRCFKYSRMPHTAEWLSLVIGMHFLSASIPNVDTLVDTLSNVAQGPTDLELWRWEIGGISLALSAALFLSARWCVRGLRAVLFCAALVLLMWGPCAVSALQFSYFFPTLDGFGDAWIFWLIVNTVNLIGYLPVALLFGIPIVATFLARRRDRFRGLAWTEWLAMTIACVLGTFALIAIFATGYNTTSIAGMAERIVNATGLIVVAILSRATIDSGVIAWAARARE
jgi:hypothetical protein